MKDKKPKIGIALGGGGARGFAHIGALKVLVENGIKPDFIVGVSMGALMGACYAMGVPLADLEAEATGFNRRKAASKLLDLANPKVSLLKGAKIDKYIKKLIGEAVFSDTKIPVHVIATDLATGDEVVLSRGSLVEAIKASISVPGIFPPVKIGDRYLIDGGVTNPTPIDVVERLGADIVLGVDLIMKRNVNLDKPSMAATLMQSYEIIRTQAVRFNLNKVNGKAVLIKPKVNGTIDSFKFYDIDKFIRAGEEAAKEVLPEIKERLGE